MTKIMVTDRAPVDLTYYRLEQLVQELPHLIKQYGEKAWLDTIRDRDNISEITLTYEREETDREYQLRLNWDKRRQQSERIEYERLKAKFGDAS